MARSMAAISRRRKLSSPSRWNSSEMVMRAARSIIWSVSTNSRPIARATSRPTEVFPAPMKPMTMMVGWIWRMAASVTPSSGCTWKRCIPEASPLDEAVPGSCPYACRAAGFPLHGHLPGKLGLTVGSTGVLRLPATLGDVLCERGEVAGGVQGPIELEATDLASEGALGQGELGFHTAAARARLGRGVEPVGHHQLAAVPGRLVGELSSQLSQTAVGQGPGQAAIANHSSQIELLDHHGAVLGGQSGGELVECVAAQVGRPGVDPRQPATGLVAAPGASCAAMQLSV